MSQDDNFSWLFDGTKVREVENADKRSETPKSPRQMIDFSDILPEHGTAAKRRSTGNSVLPDTGKDIFNESDEEEERAVPQEHDSSRHRDRGRQSPTSRSRTAESDRPLILDDTEAVDNLVMGGGRRESFRMNVDNRRLHLLQSRVLKHRSRAKLGLCCTGVGVLLMSAVAAIVFAMSVDLWPVLIILVWGSLMLIMGTLSLFRGFGGCAANISFVACSFIWLLIVVASALAVNHFLPLLEKYLGERRCVYDQSDACFAWDMITGAACESVDDCPLNTLDADRMCNPRCEVVGKTLYGGGLDATRVLIATNLSAGVAALCALCATITFAHLLYVRVKMRRALQTPLLTSSASR